MKFNNVSKILLLVSVALLSSQNAESRKALGGAGGLHTRGAARPRSNERDDPLKIASIGQGWQLPALDKEALVEKLGKENRDVAQYLCDTLGNAPLSVKLGKKTVGVKQSTLTTQEKYRAVASPGSSVKKMKDNLRSLWFIGSERAFMQSSAVAQQEKDLLCKSYEDNASKLFPSHFVLEVFLPKTRACKGGNPLVTYSIPFGPGTTSPKSKVPQANGVVTVFPNGRKRGGDLSDGIEIGKTSLHLNAGAGLVDSTWAKGRRYFWKGRDLGTL